MQSISSSVQPAKLISAAKCHDFFIYVDYLSREYVNPSMNPKMRGFGWALRIRTNDVAHLSSDITQQLNHLWAESCAARKGRRHNSIAPGPRRYGGDAEQLLLAFARAFEVDLTGFDLSRRLRGEPHLFNVWNRNSSNRLVLITVGDLYRFAVAKKIICA